jgi:hypothetical protein
VVALSHGKDGYMAELVEMAGSSATAVVVARMQEAELRELGLEDGCGTNNRIFGDTIKELCNFTVSGLGVSNGIRRGMLGWLVCST